MHQQAQGQVPCFDTNVALLVGINHVVHAGFTSRPGASEGDTGTGYILDFESHVFHDMPHPGAIVFGQSTNKAARFAVRTAVLR